MISHMRPALPLLAVLWGCSSPLPGNEVRDNAPRAEARGSVKAAQPSEAVEAPDKAVFGANVPSSLEKDAVLAILTGGTIRVDEIDPSCREIYTHAPTAPIADVVLEQRRQATTWDATCKPMQSGQACVVTLQNGEDEANEFFAQYTFELDQHGTMIDNSLRCVLAG